MRLLPALVLCLALRAAAEDAPCQGVPVVEVTLDGCAGVWCADPVEAAKVISLSDFSPGVPFDHTAATNAQKRLHDTGFFHDEEVLCTMGPAGDGAHVVLRVHPNRWIRRLDIRGHKALFESDIQKRLILGRGMAFDPNAPDGQALRKRQEESIERLYLKEGFAKTRVHVEATPVPPDGEDVTIRIREGAKVKVGAIEVQITQQPPVDPEPPFGPSVTCADVTRRQIRRAVGLSSGDSFTRRQERDATNNVRRFLRNQGLIEPEVKPVHHEGDGRLDIQVGWERCVVIRFLTRLDPSSSLSGFVPADDDDALAALTFKDSGVFDLSEAERSRDALETYFQTKGYLFADVRLEYRKAPGRTHSSPGVQGLITFYATLGDVNEIRGIRFHGNRAVKDGELASLIGTRTYDFFGSGGYLFVPQMFDDLARIRARYHELGYYRMRYRFAPIGPAPEEQRGVVRRTALADGPDDVYDFTVDDRHFRVRKDREESVVYLDIDLEEGPRSMVSDVTIAGVPQDEKLRLLGLLTLEPGETYSATKVAADHRRLERTYQELGYHGVKVTTKCTALDDGKPVERCEWQQVAAASVSIEHTIEPGERVVVGEVFIRGNTRTARRLLTADLPREGEPLSQPKLDEAERKIRALGVFSGVEIRVVGLQEKPLRRKAALVVSVEERKAQFLEFALGFESITRQGEGFPKWGASGISNAIGVTDTTLRGAGPTAPVTIPDLLLFVDVQYRHANFLGLAQEFTLPFKYGFSTQLDASAFHRLAEIRPTFREPFLLGTNVELRTSLFANYDRASNEFDLFELGGDVTLAKTFLQRLRTAFEFTGSRVQTGDFVAGIFERLEPKFSVAIDTSLDFLDDPINPKRGVFVSSRFGYISKRDEGTGDYFSYLKWDASLKVYLTVRNFLTFGAYAFYGDSTSFEGQNLPTDEIYKLGGIYGVRGFGDQGITSIGQNGEAKQINGTNGGNAELTGSVEMRFPLLRPLWVGELWSAVFFDWGALAIQRDELLPEAFNTSVGIGFRYLVGGFPIRLDAGLNLTRRPGEPTGGISFSALYPF